METRMLIGQFADTSGISKRMLRHYDKLGLIKPLIVDEENGYRYYSMDQMPHLQTIITLSRFGFTLNEIKDMLDHPMDKETFLNLLKDKEVLLRNDIDEHVSQLINIQKSINYLHKQKPGLKQILDLHTLNFERSQLMATQKSKSIETIKTNISALPDPSLFNERLEEHFTPDNTSTKFFITFDLDHFLAINELYGYDVGDAVIYYSFDIMMDGFSDMIDQGHCQVCRFGGDELVLYVEDASESTITRIVAQILQGIRDFDFSQYGCLRPITSSCGIYMFTETTHVQEPRHQSGKALMDAKRLGKDRYVMVK